VFVFEQSLEAKLPIHTPDTISDGKKIEVGIDD
jgi:hypothetical protein